MSRKKITEAKRPRRLFTDEFKREAVVLLLDGHCTRQIKWPGGKLPVNADAKAGELLVRATDVRRKPLPGLDYSDCVPLTADRVAHEVVWKEASLAAHAEQIIRFEFLLKDAHLSSMRATGTPQE